MAREAQEIDVEYVPTVVRSVNRSVRIKGTWTLYFGGGVYNFVDGQRYDLPPDVFAYLKESGNIYDTM